MKLTEDVVPERDPDEDAMWPHLDDDLAEYVDDHGPAFRAPNYEEPPDG